MGIKKKYEKIKQDFLEKQMTERWKKQELKKVEKKSEWSERVKQAQKKGRKTIQTKHLKKRNVKVPSMKGLDFGSEKGSAFDLSSFGKKDDKKNREKSAFDLF